QNRVRLASLGSRLPASLSQTASIRQVHRRLPPPSKTPRGGSATSSRKSEWSDPLTGKLLETGHTRTAILIDALSTRMEQLTQQFNCVASALDAILDDGDES